jgi:streptogramin lyase
VGPNGALWFTELEGDKAGQITTGGVITEYQLPTADSGPVWITPGPDGALWFTQFFGSKIGRVTADGTMSQDYLPHDNSYPGTIVTGPDGALWFTEVEGNNVARITTSGILTEFPLSAAGAEPQGIVVGPDEDLWFTESNTNKIARMPACGVGLSASFADHALTMNFNLGINHPAIWTLSAGKGFGFTRPIRAVTPPKPLTITYHHYPNGGNVRVKSSLSDEKGNVLCSEWTTVNTAAQ